MKYSNIVERWEHREEAVLVKPPVSKPHLLFRLPLQLCVGIVVLFPLFYGGRHDAVLALVQFLIFGSALCVALVGGVLQPNALESLALRPLGKKVSLAIAAMLGVLLVQLVPLPAELLRVLSSSTAASYAAAEAGWNSLALDPAVSTSSFFWFSALVLAALYLMALPLRDAKLSYVILRRRRSNQDSSLFKEARKVEAVSDLLQRAIIAAGVICSVVALLHVTTAADSMFGLFRPPRPSPVTSRAHWPFVNPNHLAVLLEISIMLAFSRLLRAGELDVIASDFRPSRSIGLSWLTKPEKFRNQLPWMFSLLVMILASVLSLSRAGNVLIIFGLLTIWIAVGKFSARNMVAALPRRRGDPKLSVRLEKVFARAYRPAVALGVLFIVLFFLGQSGRQVAAERIEFGLTAGVDSVRMALAKASLAIFSDHPLFGVGLGCWHVVIPAYVSASLSGWTLDFAHNDLAQLLAEVGIFGVLPACIALWALVAATLRVWSRDILSTERIELLGVGLALALPLLHSLVDFPFHIPALAFILIVCAAALLRTVERIEAKDSD